MTDALARRATITEMVCAFTKAEADTRSAFALLVQAETEVNAVFAPGATCRAIRIDATSHGHTCDFDKVDQALIRMRRAAWSQIVDKLELRRMLSVARFDAMTSELDDKKTMPPAITEENVRAFVDRFAAEMPVMIAEAVRELKALSIELDLHVMVLAQYKREATDDMRKRGRKPVISDIKGASAIEQIADKIVMLHVPFKLVENKAEASGNDPERRLRMERTASAIVGKHRDGAEGEIEMQFLGERFSFFEGAADE